jgi:hypothetical protein
MPQELLDIPGSPLGGGALVAKIEAILRALAGSRLGNSRPSDVQPGELWIDNNTDPIWYLKVWDGDADIILFSVDASTDKAMVPVSSGGTGATTPAQALQNLGGEPLISKLSGFNRALASEGQAQEGAINTALMTPLRTLQLLLAKVASQAESEAGTINNKIMTPLTTAQAIAALVKGSPPPGTMIDWPSENPPEWALVMDGAEYDRDDYADLFAVIGTAYGEGDGVTTFNVPDQRGRFRRGVPDGGTVSTYENDDIKSHNHAALNYRTSTSAGQQSCFVLDVDSNSITPSVLYTGHAGGSETLPKNIHALPIIAY